jgi:hypothetical protein
MKKGGELYCQNRPILKRDEWMNTSIIDDLQVGIGIIYWAGDLSTIFLFPKSLCIWFSKVGLANHWSPQHQCDFSASAMFLWGRISNLLFVSFHRLWTMFQPISRWTMWISFHKIHWIKNWMKNPSNKISEKQATLLKECSVPSWPKSDMFNEWFSLTFI